jgi:hypothetical protein
MTFLYLQCTPDYLGKLRGRDGSVIQNVGNPRVGYGQKTMPIDEWSNLEMYV